MIKVKAWIASFRPRTLFLAVGTTICGSGLAMSNGGFSPNVFVFATLTAVLLQLLSNLSNDLGDYQHGTDITGNRLGPERAVQSGAIKPSEMEKAIYVVVVLSLLSGSALIYQALQFMNLWYILFFLFLGLVSVAAAVKYTSGKNPYGYRGLGDIFAFLFFGPVPVVGTYFLHTHSFDFKPLLPSVGLGLLSSAVLNINNMRDMENDRVSGKITVPVRLGIDGAKCYQLFLYLGMSVCFIFYGIIYLNVWYQYFYIVLFLPFVKIMYDIFHLKENKLLDPYLKYTSISTFILSVVFSVCINA